MSVIEELIPDIKAVARSVAYKWPSVTTEEDMVQAITMRLLETQGSIDKLVSMPVDKRRAGLSRLGHQIASRERDDYEVFSGKYLYSVEDVRKLLSAGVIGGEEKRFNSSGMDVLDGMIELEKRNPKYNKAILSRYVDGVIPDRKGAGKDTLNHAIEALTVCMNRKLSSKNYDFTNGGRRGSNRQAVNEDDLLYDGAGRFDD